LLQRGIVVAGNVGDLRSVIRHRKETPDDLAMKGRESGAPIQALQVDDSVTPRCCWGIQRLSRRSAAASMT
jgi:hypothetical protein